MPYSCRKYFVGDTAKRTNLKTEVIRTQSTPNFPKKEHFLPPDTHRYVCVSGGKKCSFFGKFGVLCVLITSVFNFVFLSPTISYFINKIGKP